MPKSSRWKERLSSNEFIIIYVILALSVAIASVNSSFASVATLVTLARAGLLMMIFALCEMVVIVSGGIDVSFPAVACAAMFIPVKIMLAVKMDNLWFPFLIAMLIGIIVGFLNAVLIATLKIPPLIATLGMNSIISGALVGFLGATELSRLPQSMQTLYRTYLFTYAEGSRTYPLTILFVIPVVLAIFLALVLKYTTLGRGIYAIGGNMKAAGIAGFQVVKIQYIVYMFTGAVVGIAAIVSCVLNRSASPTNLMGIEMMIIAAVVVGGTRITGGHGTIAGTVLGVALITLIQNNLIMLGVPAHWQPFILGLLIVAGTAITSLKALAVAKHAKV